MFFLLKLARWMDKGSQEARNDSAFTRLEAERQRGRKTRQPIGEERPRPTGEKKKT